MQGEGDGGENTMKKRKKKKKGRVLMGWAKDSLITLKEKGKGNTEAKRENNYFLFPISKLCSPTNCEIGPKYV